MKTAKQLLIEDYGINEKSLKNYSWILVAMEEYANQFKCQKCGNTGVMKGTFQNPEGLDCDCMAAR